MPTLEAKGTDGQVTFDGQWLRIIRSGWTAILKGGRGEARYPLSEITAIEYRKANWTAGRFTVVIPGGVQRDTTAKAHQHDPLTVEFGVRQEPAFLAIRDAVEQAIGARRGAIPITADADDIATQLAKLGDPHQQGLLSAEEFTAAKARLIGV